MTDNQPDLNRRIRRFRRQQVFAGLWSHKFLILGGLAFLGALVSGMAYMAMPDQLEATLMGTPLNDAGVQTTRRGSQYRHELIRLETGQTIALDLPAAEPIRHDTPMKIEVYRRDLGPIHHVSYRFAGYADDEAAS